MHLFDDVDKHATSAIRFAAESLLPIDSPLNSFSYCFLIEADAEGDEIDAALAEEKVEKVQTRAP